MSRAPETASGRRRARLLLMHLVLVAVLHAPAIAHAASCPSPAFAEKPAEQIQDWYKNYIEPFRAAAGAPQLTSFTPEALGVFVDAQDAHNRRATRDPLFFETLVRQVTEHYLRAPDFRGVDTQAAGRLFLGQSGSGIDFSMLCVESTNSRARDDTLAITLYGVNEQDCRHVGLRGLVFTAVRINGGERGACRPDNRYFRRVVLPINAGTNHITFLCHKDGMGCARH